jgi:hypothetical protein
MECLICSRESYKFKEKNGFSICKCSDCGLDFLSPMPTNQELFDFYTQGYNDIRQQKKISRKNFKQNLIEIVANFTITKDSNILDFGCGNSNDFVEVCRELSYNNSFGYDKYNGKNTDLTKLSWEEVQNNQYDLITMWGVLEHLTDPVKTLSLLKKFLSKNGLIVFTTVFSDVSIPFQYKPPEHTIYFTKKSLEPLSKLSGLTILSVNDYYMKQDSDVYFQILLRTMPEQYKKLCQHKMPEFVDIPTNECIVIMKNI